MRKNYRMKNVFADKASLVPRKMLQSPDRRWVVRDFSGPGGVSLGMSQEILEAMVKKGYVERIKKGRDSYTILTNKEKLISDWVEEYSFDQNVIDTYYTADKNILNKFRKILKENQYALTSHTGANLITSFVRIGDIFIYMNLKEWEKGILDIKQKLDLKELVRGGNIHLIHPFYKNSVFFNTQKIKGYTVVSNLQLYLDLYNFQPRGREQAEHLENLLEEKGRSLE